MVLMEEYSVLVQLFGAIMLGKLYWWNFVGEMELVDVCWWTKYKAVSANTFSEMLLVESCW